MHGETRTSPGRFIQPANIIPDMTNSQAWNRYAYVLNSPIMNTDPTGHEDYPYWCQYAADSAGCMQSWYHYEGTQQAISTVDANTGFVNTDRLTDYDGCTFSTGPNSCSSSFKFIPPTVVAPMDFSGISPSPPMVGGITDDQWDTYHSAAEFATSSSPLPGVTQLPDTYQGTWELVYAGSWVPWGALLVDIVGAIVDGASLAALTNPFSAPLSPELQGIGSALEASWLLYRAQNGYGDDVQLADMQQKSDQAATIPYAGFYGSVWGIVNDLVEIGSGYKIITYE